MVNGWTEELDRLRKENANLSDRNRLLTELNRELAAGLEMERRRQDRMERFREAVAECPVRK